MKIATCLSILYTVSSAFAFQPSAARPSFKSLYSSNEENPDRPNLVSQSSFLSARETVYREVAKAQGVEYETQDDSNISYAIGRLEVDLPIPPQIDLIETPELVLVNGVSQDVMESGMQPLDTIVSVSSSDGKFKGDVMAADIEETSNMIKGAMQFARENGQSMIKFEVNRLIKGHF